MSKGFGPIYKSPVAGSIPFDNSTNDFVSDNVQSAIEEVQETSSSSSSPGFTWGRSGNLSTGTWLLNDGVPSNKAGRTIVLNNAKIAKIFTATEDLDTYNIGIYSHDGDEINITLIATLVVTASRTGNSGTVSVSVPSGKQLGAKVDSGSAKNLVVGIIMQGSVDV